ncbi:RNase H domain-containing protein [Trichonephila clavipes]|nr:RNase H domain-containing protein [Trichonephila clavipes]
MLAKNFKKYSLDEDNLVASYEWIRNLFQDTPEGLSTSEEEIFIDFTSIEKLKFNFVINRSSNFCCITPIDSFNHVEFREVLLTSTPKHSSHPELLRQLALEVINDIPDQALIIYTDGSRSDTGRIGSCIFSNTPGNDVKISIKNPDFKRILVLPPSQVHLKAFKLNLFAKQLAKNDLSHFPRYQDFSAIQIELDGFPMAFNVNCEAARSDLQSESVELP